MLNTHSSVVITCSIPHSIQKLRRRFQYKKIFFRLVEHSLVKSCAEQYQLIFPIIIFQVNLKKKSANKNETICRDSCNTRMRTRCTFG